MKIIIDKHTFDRAEERGASREEIVDVISNGESIPAKHSRLARSKVFPYQRERNGKYYEEKRIEVFYILENDTIITVTVYVFYGKWER